MNEPIRFSVQRFGGRAHQLGNGPASEGGKGSGSYGWNESGDRPQGECVVHVRDGKPVTAWGRKLLGLASPASTAARGGCGFDMGEL